MTVKRTQVVMLPTNEKANEDKLIFRENRLMFQTKKEAKNETTIRKIKDSWNREEVIELMNKSIDRGVQLKKDYKIIHKKIHIDKWISENL